jgi:hypothetical protein
MCKEYLDSSSHVAEGDEEEKDEKQHLSMRIFCAAVSKSSNTLATHVSKLHRERLK